MATRRPAHSGHGGVRRALLRTRGDVQHQQHAQHDNDDGRTVTRDELADAIENDRSFCPTEHAIHRDPDGEDHWITCGDREIARITVPRTSQDQSDTIRFFMERTVNNHYRVVASAHLAELLRRLALAAIDDKKWAWWHVQDDRQSAENERWLRAALTSIRAPLDQPQETP
jgi:hypothetical protein